MAGPLVIINNLFSVYKEQKIRGQYERSEFNLKLDLKKRKGSFQ